MKLAKWMLVAALAAGTLASPARAQGLLGDVNFDDHVDASDASLILAEYASQSTSQGTTFTNPQQKINADVNGNGIVDAIDASVTLAFYSFLSTGGSGRMEDWLADDSAYTSPAVAPPVSSGGNVVDENAHPDDALNKPVLTVTVDGKEGGRTFLLSEARGRAIDCTVKVSGADAQYGATGLRVHYSDKLLLATNHLGRIAVEPGEAVKKLALSNPVEDPTAPAGMKGFFAATAGKANYGLDGTMWTFSFTLSDDVEPGDVLPIDIVFRASESGWDRFSSSYIDNAAGRNMEAYLFTKGIYTAVHTNAFATGADVAACAALARIAGDADGYIAIADPPVTPSVSNVVARQRWPWNGLVDVDYEVGGCTTGLEARLSFAASDGRSWVATNFLAGAEPSAAPGPHRATWDTAADGAANVVAGSVAATVELVQTSFRRLALDFGGFGVRTDAASYRATLYDGAGNPTKDPLTVAIGDAPPPDAVFEFVPFATRRAVVEFLDGDGNALCETAVEGDAFPRPSLDRLVVVPVREGHPVTLRVVHAWPAETETADVRIVYDDGAEKRVFVEGAGFDAAAGSCEAVFRAAGGAASVKSVTLLRNGVPFEWLDYATAPASADGALELDVDGNEFANGAYAAGTAMQVANPRHLDNVRNHPRGGSFVQVKDIDFAGSCGILNAVAIAKGAMGTAMTSTRTDVDAKARFYGREVGEYGWFYGWLPIGSEASPFVGTYDGGGFRIANAVGNAVDASSSHALSGLFGIVGDGGAETVVTNVVLADSCSFHSNYLSALVCKNLGKLAIRDCDSVAEQFSTQYVAGMLGEMYYHPGAQLSVVGCRTGGRILGQWSGGMVAWFSHGSASLSGCVFDGTMVSSGNLGGMVFFCGLNTGDQCTIGNCTVKGALSIPNGQSNRQSGGLIGRLDSTLALTGNNSVSCEMEYSGSTQIGGVIGNSSEHSASYLRTVLSGHVTVAAGVVHDVSEANKIGTYAGDPWLDAL